MKRARSLPIWISSPLLMPSAAHAQTGRPVIKKWFGVMCSPQRGAYTVTRFLLVFFLLSSPCFGQAWSNVLSPSRAIDWTHAGLPATLPDGETTPNPWTPPTRTQSGSTVNPSGNAATDLNNINTAISNCTNGHYVLLGPGTFLIQGTVIAYGQECTLRGSGPQSTTLSMSGSGIIWMGAASNGGSCTLTSGSNYAAGSTSVTCSGSAPAVGDIVRLIQCDTGFSGSPCTGTSADNGGLFVCSFQTTCMTEPSGGGNNASQQQNFVVTSVSGSGPYTIGLNHGLYMPNWAYARTPVLSWNSPNYDGVGVGIEDMTIHNVPTNSQNWSVQMQNTYASWIKGVRFLGSPVTTAIGVNGGNENGLLLNNYVVADAAIDGNYPPAFHTDTSSDLLILNNILTYGPNWESDGGDTGVVFGYNYMRDGFTLYTLNGPYDHHGYNSFNLIEGGDMSESSEDDTWGTHDLDTYFRNFNPCSDGPYTTWTGTTNPRAMIIGGYQRFMNIVGNAFGTSGLCTSYLGTQVGTNIIFGLDSSDPLVSSTLMRWGNVSVVQQSSDTPANSGVRFVSSEVPSILSGLINSLQNPLPSNNSLPCSFFLAGYTSTSCSAHPSGGTGLSWWKVCTTWTAFPTSCSATQTQPFPTAGPDVSGGPYVNGYAYSVPASVAWQNLPVDTTYQNSYTITSSSYSNGTETLTISGLPNMTHLMGAFQLSGVNSACISGAAFNANSEILMTGSSSTTVKYALASNPGVSCTGTMKFPDVRQFDERVYMADGSGVGDPPPPNPPTNVTATVE